MTNPKQMTAERLAEIKKYNDMVLGTALQMSTDVGIRELLAHIAHLEQRIAEKQQAYSSMAEVAIRHEKECDKLKAENKRLREALSLRGPTCCEHLHHNKKDRHKWDESCPVLERINKLEASDD